jgi:hypothetical protein
LNKKGVLLIDTNSTTLKAFYLGRDKDAKAEEDANKAKLNKDKTTKDNKADKLYVP